VLLHPLRAEQLGTDGDVTAAVEFDLQNALLGHGQTAKALNNMASNAAPTGKFPSCGKLSRDCEINKLIRGARPGRSG
jgi:hypothetical protein